MSPDSTNGDDGSDDRGSDGEQRNGRSDRSRQDGDGGEGGSRQQRQPSLAEKAVMVVSVAFTVLLFAFAGWQMATTPAAGAEPKASVVGTDTMDNGSVAVTVRLRNPKGLGLISATVSSNCTSPPAEVQFSFVPAASERTGTLVCPPGTNDPSASMANWISR